MDVETSLQAGDNRFAETGDELTRAKRELNELRAQNLRAKEQIWSASARLRAAEHAMESVQLQRLRLGEAKKLSSDSLRRACGLAGGSLPDEQADTNGSVNVGALSEDASSLQELVQRQRERLESLEGEVGKLTSKSEDLQKQLAASQSEADALRRQLREQQEREAATRSALESEVLRLRAECEARQSVAVAPSASPSAQPQQPEKVIIMTSSSMRTLETEKGQPPDQSRAAGAAPALVTAPGPGTLHSPRPVMTAPAVPVRQCSAGAGPVTRQQVPVSCSSLPVFRQVSNDLRALGSPQSPAADAFGVGKDGGGPPPPAGQVFRRYSGNGGMTSPRHAAGGAANSAGGNAVAGGGAAAPPLSAGGRFNGANGLRGAETQPSGQLPGSSSAQPGHPGQLGQAAQGRSTPQRLVPSQAGADPRWSYQIPPGAVPTMATVPSGMLLQNAARA